MMNEETFTAILEAALLSFEGMNEADIIAQGIEPHLVRRGIVLCSYLKSKDLQTKQQQTLSKEVSEVSETSSKPKEKIKIDWGSNEQ